MSSYTNLDCNFEKICGFGCSLKSKPFAKSKQNQLSRVNARMAPLFTYSFCLKRKHKWTTTKVERSLFFTFFWKYDGCKRKCLTFIRHNWTTWTYSTLALDVVHPRHTTTWIYHAHSPDWAGDVRNKGGQTKSDWTFSSKTWGTHPPHP